MKGEKKKKRKPTSAVAGPDTVVRIGQEYREAISQIIEVNDPRSAAILGVSILDGMLERVIKTRMIPLSRKLNDAVFDVKSPLAGMAAKIDMGHALALYDNGVRNDLIILNRIRNRFAHHVDIHSFDHADIAELARGLRFPERAVNHPLLSVIMLAMEHFDLPEGERHHTNFVQTVMFMVLAFQWFLEEGPPTLPPETRYELSYK